LNLFTVHTAEMSTGLDLDWTGSGLWRILWILDLDLDCKTRFGQS